MTREEIDVLTGLQKQLADLGSSYSPSSKMEKLLHFLATQNNIIIRQNYDIKDLLSRLCETSPALGVKRGADLTAKPNVGGTHGKGR